MEQDIIVQQMGRDTIWKSTGKVNSNISHMTTADSLTPPWRECQKKNLEN